jgi:hypothetical protein
MQNDPALRRKTKRAGRERGCWLYIPADDLAKAGIDPADPPPFYRLNAYQRSANGHTAIVTLYKER